MTTAVPHAQPASAARDAEGAVGVFGERVGGIAAFGAGESFVFVGECGVAGGFDGKDGCCSFLRREFLIH